MKLNFPLTSQKTSTFLLSILLNTLQLKGDDQFKSCLDTEQTNPPGANFTGMYDTINNFAIKQPDKTHFCCDIRLNCGVMTSPAECPFLSPPRIFIQCNSINSASPLPSGLCGGILGNANPIVATIGTCPSSNIIINTLNSNQGTIPDKFSWLCCNSENCKLPVDIKLNDPTTISPTQEAVTGCANNEYSLMCFKDDEVWICTGGVGSTLNIWPNPIGPCLIQVSLNPSSLPANSSTNSPAASTSSSNLPTTSSSPTNSSYVENSNNSTKDIAIGVLSGVVGVIVLIAIGLLIYKLCKWRIERNILRVSGRDVHQTQIE
jgi:hypothetical protein